MKRRSLFKIAATVALAASAIAANAQQTVTLKFHTFMAPQSGVWLNMHKAWMDKVEKESGGRIKFEGYPAMQLGGSPVQLYDQAKDYYEEAFYRSLYIGAENSMGFHNPTEALRVLGDSIAFAVKSEAYLRQILTKAGVDVPIKVDLELAKYLEGRGSKKLPGHPDQEFKDPMGVQDRF